MNADLNVAAAAGDIGRLYALIETDPDVLENIDMIPFVDTPLHIAASAGQFRFATEIIRLKPSFARKLNRQGLSPMHLALKNRCTSMVDRFLSINKDLVRVKGKKGRTPLHFVAKTEETDNLAKFLSACPDSIEDLTVKGETALHIAVKKGQLAALEVLVGWLQRSSYHQPESILDILNWKNDSDETILHVSARLNNAEAVTFLVKNKINLNAKNKEGATALDIVEEQEAIWENIVETQETIRDRENRKKIRNTLLGAKAKRGTNVTDDAPTLTDRLRSKISNLDKMAISARRATVDDTTRSAILAVAVLIATLTYQWTLSPPGGVYQADASANSANNVNTIEGDPVRKGTSVMPARDFCIFWVLNTICLLVSAVIIYQVLPRRSARPLLMCPLVYLTILYLQAASIISPSDLLATVNFYLWISVPSIYIGIVKLKALGIIGGNEEIESMPASGGNRW